MKIGIIREGKIPSDSRVPLLPEQCKKAMEEFEGLEIVVQPSAIRCFKNDAFQNAGVELKENLADCQVLMGVKEVPIEQLKADKTYFFFSHTAKKQLHNRDLLRAVLDKNIRLIDYEYLVGDRGERVIAFGRFAGIVGAHNGLMAYGHRTGSLDIPEMESFDDFQAAKEFYQKLQLPPMKIVLTGGGRVAGGAEEVLSSLRVKKLSAEDFLNTQPEIPVYTQLDAEDLYSRKIDNGFDRLEFYDHPARYKSTFKPYTRIADFMINGIYWNPKAPVFFSKEEMQGPEFRIQTIADVTCDIEGSVPATLRFTTIQDPVMGYDPKHEIETRPFQSHSIDIMAVDNLPNELPKDASRAFGEQLIKHVIPELLKPESRMIRKATIAENGRVTREFSYLEDFMRGR